MELLCNTLEYIIERSKNAEDEFIKECEKRYKQIVDEICEKAMAGSGHTIIMLAGPSASGKTTTAFRIRHHLETMGHKAFCVSLDDFYLTPGTGPLDQNGNPDFETVYALDIELLKKCIRELFEKGESNLPIFDFETKRSIKKSNFLKLEKGDVVIFEGLHALNPLITDCLPDENIYKIYVSISSKIYDEKNNVILKKRNLRFIRRLVRDYNFRNSSPENTLELWKKVMDGEEKYVFRFKDFADAKINSIHLYEPCVLKEDAIRLLGEVKKDSKYYCEAQKLISQLNLFPTINKSKIPKHSLLREFAVE